MLTQLNGNREQQGFYKQGPSWAGEHVFFFFSIDKLLPVVSCWTFMALSGWSFNALQPIKKLGTLQPGVKISLTFFSVAVCFVVEISRRLVLGSNSC